VEATLTRDGGPCPHCARTLPRAARRRWPLVFAAGASLSALLGVAFADHLRHRPYPVLDLNEQWGDALLDATTAKGSICATGAAMGDVVIEQEERERPTPPARPSLPTLTSELDVGWMIQSRLERSLPETTACYRTARRASPSLDGWWAFSFTVLPDGSTAEGVVIGDTQQDAAFEGCLTELVQGWRFQPIHRPQPVTFKLPFGPAANRLAPPSLTDPAEIDQMIKSTLARSEARFRRCYEVARREEPELVGPRTLTFTVKPDGTTSIIELTGETKTRGLLENCVAFTTRRLRFQPVHKVQTVIVRLPLDAQE
jgi:hypothetical protein